MEEPHELSLPPSLPSTALQSAPVSQTPQPPCSAEQHCQLGLWGAWGEGAGMVDQASTGVLLPGKGSLLRWEVLEGEWGPVCVQGIPGKRNPWVLLQLGAGCQGLGTAGAA